MCETEVGGVIGVEEEGVDVVDGVADLGVSGYESEGFTLSEIFGGKRLSKKMCSRLLSTPLIFHKESF